MYFKSIVHIYITYTYKCISNIYVLCLCYICTILQKYTYTHVSDTYSESVPAAGEATYSTFAILPPVLPATPQNVLVSSAHLSTTVSVSPPHSPPPSPDPPHPHFLVRCRSRKGFGWLVGADTRASVPVCKDGNGARRTIVRPVICSGRVYESHKLAFVTYCVHES